MFSFFKKNQSLSDNGGAPIPSTGSGIGPEEAQLLINSLNDIRSRISQAISGGYDFADTLHNIYLDYGYPQTLTFSNFWNMYRRFGIAEAIVDLPVDTMWMTEPSVLSDDKQFVGEVGRLVELTRLWARMKAIDNRQRIGRYAGLFMRVRDNKSPENPIEGKLNGIGSLFQIIPLNEGQLKVLDEQTDPKAEDYGLPTMYQFNGSSPGNRNEKTQGTFNIHPDRIVIISEHADNGSIYGKSALEGPYNSLMDLRKILGGGGEGFYKNAAQSIVFDLKDAASAKSNAPLLEKFNENFDEFSRNRFRRGMWTPGMDAKALESNLISPKEFFFNSLYDVSASSKIPATIIIGQQTGRLASSEDSRSFLSGIMSRRGNFGTDSIISVLDWCIKWGILKNAKYEIEWDDLLALSQSEKLKNSETMATINEKQFRSGGTRSFTGEEIREEAGFDPFEEISPGSEELPGDIDE